MTSGLFTQRFAENFLPLPPLPLLAQGVHPPDFELPQVGGTKVRLSSFWGRQPVVLAFTRIFTETLFCPFCYPHIQELKDTYQIIQAQGAELLMISSLPLALATQVVNNLQLPYPFLSDPDCKIFRAYGLGQALGAPLPGQFLLDKMGDLRYVHHYSPLEANAPEATLVDALIQLAEK